MEKLQKTKLLLGLETDQHDALIELILNQVSSHLSLLLGQVDHGGKLDFVEVEVAVSRFNRLGSEGMKAQSIDTVRQDFNFDDFEPYMSIIKRFKEDSGVASRKGSVRFL